MSWAFIGISVGLLLGLTGAGGAIIAVPLFMALGGTDLGDATVLSLIAVTAGALLNWLAQTKNTEFGTAFLLVGFSTLGSWLLAPFKTHAPKWVIIALFIGAGLLSLLSTWRKGNAINRGSTPRRQGFGRLFLKSSMGGTALGGLVTMTGLGGGVIIMPFLKGACDMPLPRAAATSLLTILLSSSFSLWLQRDRVAEHLALLPVLALVGGTLISAVATRQLIQRIDAERLNHVRRVMVTIVILASTGSLLFNAVERRTPVEPSHRF